MKMYGPLLVAVTLTVAAVHSAELSMDEQWNNFKSEYNRDYEGAEETERKRIFTENLERISQHNQEADEGRHSYWLGVNQFADMRDEEIDMKPCLVGGPAEDEVGTEDEDPETTDNQATPSEIDWRKKGCVTTVKNQGKCGSCWAFSATGAVESQQCIKKGRLISLSEQNLVDCSWSQGNKGCKGGLPHRAFQYIMDNNGINTEKCYQYQAINTTCRFKPERKCIGAQVSGYTRIKSKREAALQSVVATKGPVSILIDARNMSFKRYQRGVYDEPACTTYNLTHAVLVVGYGRTSGASGKEYWIVKNSWGEAWGEKGYIRMIRNKDNQCGVLSAPFYPTVRVKAAVTAEGEGTVVGEGTSGGEGTTRGGMSIIALGSLVLFSALVFKT